MTERRIEHSGHISSHRTLLSVWVALLVLTGVTVALSRLDLGVWHVWGALAIAVLKGALVIMYFMHMRSEGRLLKWLLFLALLTLALFIGATFFDISFRQE